MIIFDKSQQNKISKYGTFLYEVKFILFFIIRVIEGSQACLVWWDFLDYKVTRVPKGQWDQRYSILRASFQPIGVTLVNHG